MLYLEEIIPTEIETYSSEAMPALSGDEIRSDKLLPSFDLVSAPLERCPKLTQKKSSNLL